MASTNGYIIYQCLYDDKKAKKTSGLPPKMIHLEFLEELIHDFMGWRTKTMPPTTDASVASGLVVHVVCRNMG